MLESFALVFVNVFLIYLVAGFVFALAFVSRGVQRVDPGANGSSWGFRLLIFPGAVAFWPFLLNKWAKSKDHGSGT